MSGDKVESVETFTNSAGTRLVIHLRPSRTLSDRSVNVRKVSEDIQRSLLDWLNEADR